MYKHMKINLKVLTISSLKMKKIKLAVSFTKCFYSLSVFHLAI